MPVPLSTVTAMFFSCFQLLTSLAEFSGTSAVFVMMKKNFRYKTVSGSYESSSLRKVESLRSESESLLYWFVDKDK